MKSKETVCRFPASVVEHLEPGDIQRPAEAQRRDDIIAHDDGFVGTHETVVGIEHLLDEPGAAARIAAHEREGRMRRRMVHPSPEMLWRETFDQRERFSFRGGIGWTITLHLRAGDLLGARRRVEGFITVAARVAIAASSYHARQRASGSRIGVPSSARTGLAQDGIHGRPRRLLLHILLRLLFLSMAGHGCGQGWFTVE